MDPQFNFLGVHTLSDTSHVERMGDEKLAEIRCPESGVKKDARKTIGRTGLRDLERVGENWRTTAREKELETADIESSERKVRKETRKKR